MSILGENNKNIKEFYEKNLLKLYKILESVLEF